MGRTEDHLHPRKAAVMATLLFALSVPAIAIPTVPHHIAHHAAPAVSTHRRAVAHTQKAAVKTKSSRHHAAAAAEPDSAAKVHEWEAAHHGAAPAVRTKKVKPQSAKAVAHPAAQTLPTPGVAASMTPVPLMFTKHGRVVMPAALKGSHDILVHQNQMADVEGLDRIRDDADLERKVAAKELVAIPASGMLRVDERLPENRRYCRPWVAQFLTDVARAHYAQFHTPLQVNSAVRTVEFQERLRHTNGNAAPAGGEDASPHLTGLAIDIAKKPLTQTEIAWMRSYLLPLEQAGKIDVEEEFQQACFHMSVYRQYNGAPWPANATAILAISMR